MTTTNDSLRLAELLKTPICKMDGEELAFLITSITTGAQSQPKTEDEHAYKGGNALFGKFFPTLLEGVLNWVNSL